HAPRDLDARQRGRPMAQDRTLVATGPPQVYPLAVMDVATIESPTPQPRDLARPAALAHRRAASVAFPVSLGVLLIDISLTRLLSFTLWYHFTYVVIAVALLGYGASGAFLSSWDRLARVAPPRLITGAALAGAASLGFLLLAIRLVPFEPLRVGSDPRQIAWMVIYL